MTALSLPQQIAVAVFPLLTAITLHEASHAYVANFFGDTTAKAQGRLSLNPIKHIDPFGTIIVPLLIGILSQFTFIFGWAKPVPITPSRLKKPRRDMILVSIAGPLSNLIMAFMWAAILKATLLYAAPSSNIALFLLLSARIGILMNLILALFNLLPIPPLDGSKVVSSFLSYNAQIKWYQFERYGFLILLLLIYTGVISQILSPALNVCIQFISQLFQL